jgi:dienelactone hydrolase
VILSPKVEGSSRSDLPCYQVGPSENPKRILVVFTDVFGVDSGNHKVFCDVLQELMGDETAVWMPDIFRGTPMLLDLGNDTLTLALAVPQILWKLHTSLTVPKIELDLKEIIEPNLKETGCDHVGVSGFCIGGWMVGRCLALENGQSIFSAGVGIHPSWQVEPMASGGSSEHNLAERTKNKPILLLPAKEDDALKPSSSIVQQLAKRRAMTPESISIEFPEMSHGWVARGDSSIPSVKEAQDKALHLVAAFFQEHLKLE